MLLFGRAFKSNAAAKIQSLLAVSSNMLAGVATFPTKMLGLRQEVNATAVSDTESMTIKSDSGLITSAT